MRNSDADRPYWTISELRDISGMVSFLKQRKGLPSYYRTCKIVDNAVKSLHRVYQRGLRIMLGESRCRAQHAGDRYCFRGRMKFTVYRMLHPRENALYDSGEVASLPNLPCYDYFEFRPSANNLKSCSA
eukprot:IDg17178t1